MPLKHLMLVRFQHEQLLQEYRHTHEAHIFVAVESAPIPATKCGINIVWFNVLDFQSKNLSSNLRYRSNYSVLKNKKLYI